MTQMMRVRPAMLETYSPAPTEPRLVARLAATVRAALAAWAAHSAGRRALETLNDRLLTDVGLDPYVAERVRYGRLPGLGSSFLRM